MNKRGLKEHFEAIQANAVKKFVKAITKAAEDGVFNSGDPTSQELQLYTKNHIGDNYNIEINEGS